MLYTILYNNPDTFSKNNESALKPFSLEKHYNIWHSETQHLIERAPPITQRVMGFRS